MSAHDPVPSPGNDSVRFEPTDVATKPILTSVIVLAVLTLVFTGVAHLVFFALAAREAAVSPPASPLAEYAAKEPPEPRLQIHPKGDLDVLRAAEAKALGTLAWVDKDAGVVRVPIERAMELLLAKGLPAREGGEVPANMKPRGIAPAQPGEAAGAPDWWGGFRVSHGEREGGVHHDSAHGATEGGHGKVADLGKTAHGSPHAGAASHGDPDSAHADKKPEAPGHEGHGH